MNKATFQGIYDYFRMVHKMTRRIVDQFPADKMNYKPTPDQRTVAETVCHMYTFLCEAMETVKSGQFVEPNEPKITNKAELLAYVDSQVEKAYVIFETIKDEHLERVVSAYEMEFPAWRFLAFAYDEHWHHRGALTVYLRLCGIEPIMIYDYAN